MHSRDVRVLEGGAGPPCGHPQPLRPPQLPWLSWSRSLFSAQQKLCQNSQCSVTTQSRHKLEILLLVLKPSNFFERPCSGTYHYTPRIGVKSLDFECLQRQHLHLWDFCGAALQTVGVTDTHKAPPVESTMGRWALHSLELFHKDVFFIKTADCDQFSYGHLYQLYSMSNPIHFSYFDLEEARLPWGTAMRSCSYCLCPIHIHIKHPNSVVS